MLKKRILVLGLLLAASIAGQILLRPSFGQSDPVVTNENKTSPLNTWNPQTSKSVDTLGGKLAGKFILMLAFIAAAGVGVGWFVKKMNTPWLGSKNGQLELLETMHLGTRKAIHVIRAGQKRILVGSGNDGIRFLCEMTESLDSPSDEVKI